MVFRNVEGGGELENFPVAPSSLFIDCETRTRAADGTSNARAGHFMEIPTASAYVKQRATVHG